MIYSLKARKRRPYDNSVEKELTLGFNEVAPYRIADIDGLGPVKASFDDLDTPLDAGTQYLFSKDGSRNIVLTVETVPNEGQFSPDPVSTVSALRKQMYGVFTPRSKIELYFDTDDFGYVRIDGIVESVEPDMFTDRPTVVISVICHDPYFYNDPLSPMLLDANFIGSSRDFWVDYPGNVEIGFIWTAQILGARPNGTYLQHAIAADGNSRTGPVYLSLNVPLEADDTITVNTRKGQRSVIYRRSFADKNGLPYFTGSLVDSKLHPGRNYFTVENRTQIVGHRITVNVPIDGI